MHRRTAPTLALMLALTPLGCSVLFAISDDAASGVNGDDDGAAADGGAESGLSSDGDANATVVRTCKQTGRGPQLVNIGDRVCIDATEVTLEQYEAFVATGEVPEGMPERCAANDNRKEWLVADAANMPAFYLEWCDAYAYCAWAGKKLCGAFPGHEQDAATAPDAQDAGFSHGLASTELQDREANVWLWACGGGAAARSYPYGNDFDAAAGCVSPGGGVLPVQTRRVGAGCEGPIPGAFDFVGNVAEWIDSCYGDVCVAMGSANCKDPSFGALEYEAIRFQLPNLTEEARGIRCCGVDPPAP